MRTWSTYLSNAFLLCIYKWENESTPIWDWYTFIWTQLISLACMHLVTFGIYEEYYKFITQILKELSNKNLNICFTSFDSSPIQPIVYYMYMYSLIYPPSPTNPTHTHYMYKYSLIYPPPHQSNTFIHWMCTCAVILGSF